MAGIRVVLFLLLGLGGCNVEMQDAPEIEGRLRQGETSLAGVRVTRLVRPGDRPGCEGRGAATVTTDAQGRFHFPRVVHRQRTILFGDPVDDWRLCFDTKDGGPAWWGRGKIAAPRRAVVQCTPLPGAHPTSAEGRGEGVQCSVRDERAPRSGNRTAQGVR